MPKISIKAGTTSKSVGILIQDTTTTDGSGLIGLLYNTASLIAYWYQPGITAPAAITLATLASATAAYSSGGFYEVDSVHMKGHYRFDIPNACLTGATDVIIELSGATNMAPCRLEIDLAGLDIDASGHIILQATGLDNVIKDAYTMPELIALIGAACMGKISGLPASPATFRSVDDTANRIVTAFDADNNRTSVTLTPP